MTFIPPVEKQEKKSDGEKKWDGEHALVWMRPEEFCDSFTGTAQSDLG